MYIIALKFVPWFMCISFAPSLALSMMNKLGGVEATKGSEHITPPKLKAACFADRPTPTQILPQNSIRPYVPPTQHSSFRKKDYVTTVSNYSKCPKITKKGWTPHPLEQPWPSKCGPAVGLQQKAAPLVIPSGCSMCRICAGVEVPIFEKVWANILLNWMVPTLQAEASSVTWCWRAVLSEAQHGVVQWIRSRQRVIEFGWGTIEESWMELSYVE